MSSYIAFPSLIFYFKSPSEVKQKLGVQGGKKIKMKTSVCIGCSPLFSVPAAVIITIQSPHENSQSQTSAYFLLLSNTESDLCYLSEMDTSALCYNKMKHLQGSLRSTEVLLNLILTYSYCCCFLTLEQTHRFLPLSSLTLAPRCSSWPVERVWQSIHWIWGLNLMGFPSVLFSYRDILQSQP